MQSNNPAGMKKVLFLLSLIGCQLYVQSQSTGQKLKQAFSVFEKDSQMKHGIASLYVIDAQTGHVVFDKNSRIGLAPASTQKVIVAATAYALLGKDFRYTTELWVTEGERGKTVELTIGGNGDPTLGSWRYASTVDSLLLKKWALLVKSQVGDKRITGIRILDRDYGDIISIPGGYVWDDMGNYYGAGWSFVNWRENQYDLYLKSQMTGAPVMVQGTYPRQDQVQFNSLVTGGQPGTGDNAYIFCPPYSTQATIRGTIPPGKDSFVISGASPDPAHTLGTEFFRYLKAAGLNIDSVIRTGREVYFGEGTIPSALDGGLHQSPPLDSIVYWYLKKSVNLYGEALLQTLPVKNPENMDPDARLKVLQDFWTGKGISAEELNLYDGSGLSPANRVTTHAQVEILRYAKNQPWFSSYKESFPLYNEMTMKSGTIGDVKGFTGYHKASNGKEYIFSFLVNNYNGPSSLLVKKMYKVLDNLK